MSSLTNTKAKHHNACNREEDLCLIPWGNEFLFLTTNLLLKPTDAEWNWHFSKAGLWGIKNVLWKKKDSSKWKSLNYNPLIQSDFPQNVNKRGLPLRLILSSTYYPTTLCGLFVWFWFVFFFFQKHYKNSYANRGKTSNKGIGYHICPLVPYMWSTEGIHPHNLKSLQESYHQK